MPSLPKLSTVITWFLYSIPIYIFVLDPLLRGFFPGLLPASDSDSEPRSNKDIFDFDDAAAIGPGLNLTDDSFISPEDGVPFDCPNAEGYRVHLLSRAPLIMYIENFISETEANHLLDVSIPNYKPSILYDGHTERIDPTKRLSDRALLDRDNTVRCLEDRARAFQGWRPNLYIERMWAQRYNTSGHYRHHYDWTGSLARGGDRLSTFMVYLDAQCEGGGTNFPRLKMPRSKEWCRFLECEDGHKGNEREAMPEGITFKPIKGNAVFWENLRPDGSGYPETWHAAFPVMEGTKVGLNIWSWYQPGRR
ncbi:hypothetical protein N7499_009936 [Penicillium canescens]|uniref:Prolyl 4-hydroxylase alpha subunit domain-containing protein n=1 Tax=Penicillium canescens TaxID=5083 RepID=A0AAD6NE51_PENCN|nr:uncharacterized protein N7446_008045 [Penicillium canescens]KAJ6018884.1 hypothetical protein N7522_000951 [Penicillium canescens]KAJ6033661.1 hypothetical protein N7444_011432 [Penicillium canescens]KAJ6057146.1 hypothetical protein N7460_000420 [Penicillium canescens]KAJ6058462.1 hypothetical protein N7446_008045 [Penicillium canescens]KAJ6071922.1 hypothetical protein N7499_009936 [Penicillium canescens]